MECTICFHPYTTTSSSSRQPENTDNETDETNRDPKILQCGHTFCFNCLQNLVVTTPTSTAANRDGGSGSQVISEITCPMCRTVSLTTQVRNNYALAEMVQAVKQMTGGTGGSGGAAGGENFDQKEKQALSDVVGGALAVRARTRSGSSSPPGPAPALTCAAHPNTPVDTFCETCSKFICRYCYQSTSSAHGRCSRVAPLELRDRLLQNVKQRVETLDRERGKKIEDLRTWERACESKFELCRSNGLRFFDVLLQEVGRQREKFIHEMEGFAEARRAQLREFYHSIDLLSGKHAETVRLQQQLAVEVSSDRVGSAGQQQHQQQFMDIHREEQRVVRAISKYLEHRALFSSVATTSGSTSSGASAATGDGLDSGAAPSGTSGNDDDDFALANGFARLVGVSPDRGGARRGGGVNSSRGGIAVPFLEFQPLVHLPLVNDLFKVAKGSGGASPTTSASFSTTISDGAVGSGPASSSSSSSAGVRNVVATRTNSRGSPGAPPLLGSSVSSSAAGITSTSGAAVSYRNNQLPQEGSGNSPHFRAGAGTIQPYQGQGGQPPQPQVQHVQGPGASLFGASISGPAFGGYNTAGISPFAFNTSGGILTGAASSIGPYSRSPPPTSSSEVGTGGPSFSPASGPTGGGVSSAGVVTFPPRGPSSSSSSGGPMPSFTPSYGTGIRDAFHLGGLQPPPPETQAHTQTRTPDRSAPDGGSGGEQLPLSFAQMAASPPRFVNYPPLGGASRPDE